MYLYLHEYRKVDVDSLDLFSKTFHLCFVQFFFTSSVALFTDRKRYDNQCGHMFVDICNLNIHVCGVITISRRDHHQQGGKLAIQAMPA